MRIRIRGHTKYGSGSRDFKNADPSGYGSGETKNADPELDPGNPKMRIQCGYGSESLPEEMCR